MSKFNLPQISMEAIASQRQSLLFFDLVSVIQQLRALPEVDQTALDRSGINEIIKRRTGLKVRCVVNQTKALDHRQPPQYTGCFAELPILSSESALFKICERIDPLGTGTNVLRFQQAIRAADQLTGKVDLKAGTVSGVFAELLSHIWLDAFVLHALSPGTPEEAAAVVLHEIGHIYSGFETCVHTTVTNMIIVTALEALRDEPEMKIKVKLVDQAINAYGGDRKVADAIANAESEETQRLLLLKTYEDFAQDKLKQAFGEQDVYNYRSVEFMSDQYALRHAGAIPLASALHKLFKLSRENYSTTAARFYGVEAARYGLVLVGMLTPLWPVAAVIGASYSMITAVMTRDDDHNPSPLQRMSGIKQDLVQMLKNTALPARTRQQLLQDIDFIDALRAEAKEHDSVARFVWKNLFPQGRRATKIHDFQKGLEDLINNDLFIHASRLKQA